MLKFLENNGWNFYHQQLETRCVDEKFSSNIDLIYTVHMHMILFVWMYLKTHTLNF